MIRNWEVIVAAVILLLGIIGAIIVGAGAALGHDSPPITCNVKWVHDGDTFRCEGYEKSTRLYGIDAPEMLGACRAGRQCVPGNPYASRDYLEQLIGNRPLHCQLIDTDRYGRPVMRCSAGRTDLSCAMVKTGKAVERYGRLGC